MRILGFGLQRKGIQFGMFPRRKVPGFLEKQILEGLDSRVLGYISEDFKGQSAEGKVERNLTLIYKSPREETMNGLWL